MLAPAAKPMPPYSIGFNAARVMAAAAVHANALQWL